MEYVLVLDGDGQHLPEEIPAFLEAANATHAAALCETESSKYDFETEMLVIAARRGGSIATVPVSTVYGDEVSKIHPLRDTIRFFQLMHRLKHAA